MARALGSNGQSAPAVSKETAAVPALMVASTPYSGYQSVSKSAQWPAPQSKMKAAKSPNTGLNTRSWRRRMNRRSTTGMEK